MTLELRRVILFTPNLESMTAFYRDVLGLSVTTREPGWVEFAAGGCGLALHAGKSEVGKRPPKLAFFSSDVAATRALLIGRGLVDAGPVKSAGQFAMCDCRDPDGNLFQISGRV